MFSALKKLTSKTEIQNVPPESAGQPMSGTLQKKFSRGVQYNMKIIIKGDRNVGKSCLLERLQGRGFIETYMPTEEIQVASIQWSFKATEDIVKVEVWDVVDRGKARIRNTNGLKLTSNIPSTEVPALDAEFLDVYKGTHGVIIMMDVTKMWTFEYVQREIVKIPPELPILVLGNHCDMGHHRVVTEGQVIGFIENLPVRTGEIQYGESSMRNGFGLRLLHKFLGLPFLHLQKATLLSLLERNQKDTEICSFEITEFLKSDDSDYNKFIDNLTNKRRSIADNNPKSMTPSSSSIPHSPSSSSISSNVSVGIDVLRPTKSIIVGGGQPIVIPGQLNVTNDPKFRAQSNAAIGNSNATSNILTMRNEVQEAIAPLKHIPDSNVVSVEEFCPDGGLDKGFLDDFTSSPLNNKSYISEKVPDSDTDTEENGANPLVASFNDEPEYEEPRRSAASSVTDEIQHQVKINPLAPKISRKSLILESNEINLRKLSISSEEIITSDNKSRGVNSFTQDELNDWLSLSDTNLRRSPEGGEDLPVVTVSQETDNISVNKMDDSVKIKKNKKHKKDKKEKKDRSSRSGDGDDSGGDNKSISRKEKKSKKSRKKDEERTTELNDFLNDEQNNSFEHRGNEYECI